MTAAWKQGDVVAITDAAHLGSICVLTSASQHNKETAWLLSDATCLQWRSTEWVENRSPRLLVRNGAATEEPTP